MFNPALIIAPAVGWPDVIKAFSHLARWRPRQRNTMILVCRHLVMDGLGEGSEDERFGCSVRL